jgi:uncharacterized protein
VLIVAYSGRMLAQAARRDGFLPVVIDVCGDEDTYGYAQAVYRVKSLAKCHIMPVVKLILARYPVYAAVYGSGLELYLESLYALADSLILFGNKPSIGDMFGDKAQCFAELSALNIPFPKVSFGDVSPDTDWLFKPMRGHGGLGIVKADKRNMALQIEGYWQKYQTGNPHSVLFTANGAGFRIVGFNRQWAIKLDEQNEFIFSGVINNPDITEKHKKIVESWVAKLVIKYGLRGLNSLDFIQDEAECYFLEINTRPSASMQLYQADLFNQHVNACNGDLTGYRPIQDKIVAYQVIYAFEKLRVPDNLAWSDYAMDIPVPGTIINTGQPICSIIAHGKNHQTVLNQLERSQQAIMQQLNRFKSYGI